MPVTGKDIEESRASDYKEKEADLFGITVTYLEHLNSFRNRSKSWLVTKKGYDSKNYFTLWIT